jgi:hypothetical protein
MPKKEDGSLNHHVALTGPDLVEFVDQKLFPYLANFKYKADNPQTLEYKIGEIFSELKNKIQSGYNLREIIELANGLPDGIFVGVSPAFGEFAYRKFLKKEQTKYLKETTKHSFGRILWTGIKGVSMYFFIAFFFLLSIIIFDIQLP